MKIVSILENQNIDKRIAITPEIAKKYIALGFEISLVEKYGEHLGFKDNDYKILGVKISNNETEILKNSDIILISSGFAKYNAANLDTIFTESVVIENLQNKIIGEYLDLSMLRKNIIISKNVVFNNNSNILKTDVIEIDIDTKNTKFYMYEKDKKVSIVKTN